MSDLERLKEMAGIVPARRNLEENSEDVIGAVVKAIVYAYNEQFPNDGDQGMNDFDRLEAINDIANAARHKAGDIVTNEDGQSAETFTTDDGREEPISGRMSTDDNYGVGGLIDQGR